MTFAFTRVYDYLVLALQLLYRIVCQSFRLFYSFFVANLCTQVCLSRDQAFVCLSKFSSECGHSEEVFIY